MSEGKYTVVKEESSTTAIVKKSDSSYKHKIRFNMFMRRFFAPKKTFEINSEGKLEYPKNLQIQLRKK
ncbi:hypothetical protein KAS31_03485 [Candidatus Parcubacteria bacterium]|nr:hypothetical protein [Candidatus Parcubacteria bacterium]